MRIVTRLALPLAAAGGAALAGAALAGALLRRTKPLHPEGVGGDAVLTITPTTPSGIPLLDTAGEHPAELRWSRAVGLPSHWPDIEGLAVRVEGADVLFASTGTGAVGRYLLVLRAPGRHGDLTTLLPLRSTAGPLLLRVSPAGPGSPVQQYELSWSRARGPWHVCGHLRASWHEQDSAARFHPVGRELPGTSQYPLVTALRAPAYAVARQVAARPREAATSQQ